MVLLFLFSTLSQALLYKQIWVPSFFFSKHSSIFFFPFFFSSPASSDHLCLSSISYFSFLHKSTLNSWPLFFAGVDRSSDVGGAACIWQQRVRGCIALLGLRQWWWSGSAGPAVAAGLIAGSPAGARGSHIQLGRQI
jgi:hypothetical protein